LSKIKLNEILESKTIDLILMNEKELQEFGEKATKIFMSEKYSLDKDINKWSESQKKEARITMQYGYFNSALEYLNKEHSAYYNALIRNIHLKKGNTEIDLEFMTKLKPYIKGIREMNHIFR